MKEFIRAKGSLQNKFLVLFIFISIVPIITCMLYVSSVTLGQMTENVERTSVTQLKNIDATVWERYKSIQRVVENICLNKDIQGILAGNTADGGLFASQIKGCTRDSEDIYGIVCIADSGEAYAYNVDIAEIDATRLQIIYGRTDERPGALTWFGNSYLKNQGFGENIIMAVSPFNRLDEDNSYKQLGKIYLYVKSNIFTDAFGDVGDDSLVLLDSEGILLSGVGKEKYAGLFQDDLMLIESMFAEDEGVVRTDISQKRNISFAHYTSKLTGFKYLKIYDNDILYERINNMRLFIILFIIALIIVALAVYVTIANRVTKPIAVLSRRMKNMSLDSLDEKVRAVGNDEIADIMNGYNRMLDRITEMIEEIKEKERQKKESDIRALQYRINPHFLHNTLASVRIAAIKHNDTEVSQAILDINRILKSVFSSASSRIAIDEEIKLLNSFARLLSLRYNDRIEFSINAEAEIGSLTIPSMVVQPLLENAVMHGVGPKMKEADFVPHISVEFKRAAGNIKIVIRDNGIGISDSALPEEAAAGHGSGIGMENVSERIRLICGEEYGLSVSSEPGEYTEITIILPSE